jgi:hypothetical protein
LGRKPRRQGGGDLVEANPRRNITGFDTPREGAIIFRDLVGKLDVLRIECDKCGRRGRYRLDRLVWRYGIDAKLFERGRTR